MLPQPLPSTLLAEELDALLGGVSAFAAQEILTRAPRPEQALSEDDFRAITAAADAAGLLDNSDQGYGLWSECGRGEAPGFTLMALRQLALANAAAAWHLHSVALAALAARFAGLDSDHDTVFCLDGAQGIGRSALGRLLAGRPLHTRDADLLADVYGASPRVTVAAPGVTRLAALRYRGRALQLDVQALAKITLERDEFPHGPDGCHALRWTPAAKPAQRGPLTLDQLNTLFAAQQLAQTALARGAVEAAAALAHRYAEIRVQGARTIEQHDSVALLLADLDTPCQTVDALLRDAARQPLSTESALALRREAMPLLTRAANAAMQVHGGIGYMRDTGIEHRLRAVNALRLLGGSPPELALVAAGLASDHAALPEAEAAGHDHLPGYLSPQHALSPFAALRRGPLLRAVAAYTARDPWDVETDRMPATLGRLRRKVRRFALQHCLPLANSTDREQRESHHAAAALQQLLADAGAAGLLTDLLPAPLGGASPFQFRHSLALQQAIRVEELARADGGLMLLLSAHSLGLCPLLLSGDLGILREVVLPAFRATQAGQPQIFAFAITEPAAGSDAEDGHGALHQKAGVKARRVPGGWSLRGRKVFISGGDVARYVSVFAALEGEGYDSWTCFLVDTASPGFRVARCELKMGMRASGAAELEFDDCFVPDNRVVGGLRNGWGLARATLNLSRLPVAAMAVGFAQQAVDIATAWACTQTLAGKPLIHYQQVQAVIADLQAETGAIRALVWQHAKGWTPRQDGAALCKFQATDRAQVVIETAMDLLGSAAILHDNRLERTFRDCRLTRIFEGTNQINRLAVIEDQQAGLLDRIARRAGRAFTGA